MCENRELYDAHDLLENHGNVFGLLPQGNSRDVYCLGRAGDVVRDLLEVIQSLADGRVGELFVRCLQIGIQCFDGLFQRSVIRLNLLIERGGPSRHVLKGSHQWNQRLVCRIGNPGEVALTDAITS
jgi:hypothetical protein